jgi:hypothetical protein
MLSRSGRSSAQRGDGTKLDAFKFVFGVFHEQLRRVELQFAPGWCPIPQGAAPSSHAPLLSRKRKRFSRPARSGPAPPTTSYVLRRAAAVKRSCGSREALSGRGRTPELPTNGRIPEFRFVGPIQRPLVGGPDNAEDEVDRNKSGDEHDHHKDRLFLTSFIRVIFGANRRAG